MKIFLRFIAMLLAASVLSAQAENGTVLELSFLNEVDRRLYLPLQERERYAQLLEAELKNAGVQFTASQYILIVDRNPNVQAVLVYWFDLQASSKPFYFIQSSSERFHFIGASPVSTGRPGGFDYFITPLGVFDHSLANKDFRAEGTYNQFGIRGFGRKGMRVFDFGWVQATRSWGNDGKSQMRLLLHATDPDRLEQYLGTVRSKGCVRIPETFNSFIDRYGLLDADYEQVQATGDSMWVLRSDRTPTPWPGRYLVIIDSGRMQRPVWSSVPAKRIR